MNFLCTTIETVFNATNATLNITGDGMVPNASSVAELSQKAETEGFSVVGILKAATYGSSTYFRWASVVGNALVVLAVILHKELRALECAVLMMIMAAADFVDSTCCLIHY